MNEMSKPVTAVSPATLARMIAVVGEKNAITDKDKQTPYLVEFRALWTGHTPVVLRPGSTQEVSELLKIANETSTAIVPQGGNTGLVGGQIPHNGEIVLSLNRMDKIREVDPVSNTITCEAGVTLQRAREAAANVDRLYPQLLPSEGSCTIGGNLSTNAGGTAALALRHRALARARPRGGAGRRPHHEQSQQAQEGQHRLRPARSVHRRRRHARRHHRGGAAARAAAEVGRDRVGRDPVGAGRGRSARPCHRAHRRRRDELRDHGARGHRHRAQASAARAIRWRRRRPIRC